MTKNYEKWQESFGLALIDQEEPSKYLQNIAEANIIGMITDTEAENLLKEYYSTHGNQEEYETDLIILRIKRILTINQFELSKNFFISIHKYIFKDTKYNGGIFRTFPISKKEEILDGKTVIYSPPDELHARLDYDFSIQQNKKMKGLSAEETIYKVIPFISNIWQNHPFVDGNTRTTSIFTEKYLNSLGFATNNSVFKDNATYFRNALVRNNPTTNYDLNYTDEYLIKFFMKLLVDNSIILDPNEQIVHSRSK